MTKINLEYLRGNIELEMLHFFMSLSLCLSLCRSAHFPFANFSSRDREKNRFVTNIVLGFAIFFPKYAKISTSFHFQSNAKRSHKLRPHILTNIVDERHRNSFRVVCHNEGTRDVLCETEKQAPFPIACGESNELIFLVQFNISRF